MSDLNVNTFKARRAEIVKRMDKNSVLLISSAKLVSRNNDTTFPFRQDSNFYYLTGFQEPDSVMLLHSNGCSTLFCREKNPDLEKWEDPFVFVFQMNSTCDWWKGSIDCEHSVKDKRCSTNEAIAM